MISRLLIRFRLNILVGVTLSMNVFAQGDDCLTALQLNNVSNYCSGAAFYTNAGSTTGTWGTPLALVLQQLKMFGFNLLLPVLMP